MGRPCVGLVLVGLVASCIDSGLVPCGDLVCPAGTTCIAGACASPADVDACVGKADNEPCPSESDGFCNGGACRGSVCGDLFVSPDEVCDDGNRTNGDGCSDDCRSTEICGNAVVDFIHGEECDDGTVGLSGDGCTSSCRVEYDTWRRATPQPIGDRYAHAMAYDAARDRMVTFGASSLLGLGADTWEFDGVNWVQRVVVVSPTARSGYGMTAGPSGGVLMFGGATGNGYTDETWTWDGTQWVNRSGGTAPSPRYRVAMALDTKRQRVVLFGGATASADLADTWVFDGTGWSQLAPPMSPPARSHAAMAYDPVRDRIVLMGGSSPAGPRNDVWEFDGTTWAPRLAGPAAREGHGMVYDAARVKTVVFGGDDGAGGDLTDTWEWTGAAWSQNVAGSQPGTREDFAIAYNSTSHLVIMHGGIDLTFFGISQHYSDTLAHGSTWTLINTTASPGQRELMSFAFDALRGRGVLAGGVAQSGDTIESFADTWEWDGVTWSARTPAHQPPPPSFSDLPVAIYDEARHVVTQIRPPGQMWTWDGIDWHQLGPFAVVPPTRQQTSIVYDAARARIVLFGGSTTSGNVGDTWEWDGAWTQRAPAMSPSPRVGNGLVYDAHRHVVVLYGGSGLGDTWEYDGTTWTERTPAASPPPRDAFTMVYDASRHRVMMFGGSYFNQYLGDTWEWDGTSWTQRAPVLSPSKRFGSASIFDSRNGQVVMFGGRQFDDLDETWTYEFGTTADPGERCDNAAEDTDHDGLAGCADPDCWGRCTPLCPPGTTCDPTAPHCGDGVCGPVEDYLICPGDCPSPG